MRKNLFGIWMGLVIVLSACSSPTPTATQVSVAPTATAALASATAAPTTASKPTAAPTSTAAPTDTPAPANTAAPAATSTPATKSISAANLSGIAKSGVVAIPRPPSLVLDPNVNGIRGAFTPDSQHIILRTDAGVEVLAAQTLAPVANYPGLQLISVLQDGRFAALDSGRLVLVDPVAGKSETVKTEASFAGLFDVSSTGKQLASLVDSKTLRLYDLTGGAAADIAISGSDSLNHFGYTPDGGYLVLQFPIAGRFDVYDAATAKKVYDVANTSWPVFSLDGKYFVTADFNGLNIADTVTGKIANKLARGYTIKRGCDATTCVDDGVHLLNYFLAGGPETAITFWRESNATGKPAATLAEQNWKTVETDTSYVQNLVTGVKTITFSGYNPDELALGLGAPDGSAFVLIKNTAQLFLHSLKDGKLLAQSARYTVGGGSVLSTDGALVGWSNLQGVGVYDWQKAAPVLQQPQPQSMTEASRASFVPDGHLLVEAKNTAGGFGLSYWSISTGKIDKTIGGVSNCRADAAGIYILCHSATSQRILALASPDKIVFNATDLNTYTVLSPTGDSYVSCLPGSKSLTYRLYASKTTTLAFACQAMFYSADATQVYLQDGTVVSLATGKATLTLAKDAQGHIFKFDLKPADGGFASLNAPAVFFGPDFIVIDQRLFDARSGKLLVELPIATVNGISLSKGGLTLNVLTPAGIEQWRVAH